jgi:gliding motility-associated protein GldL
MAILGEKQMAFLYGMGAAVVIIGALFKLMHWPGASLMLIVGLTTEALIFGLSAFEPIPHKLDWTLVYPELAGGEAKPKEAKKSSASNEDADCLLSKKLDNILKEAKLDAELINILRESI